MPTPTRVAPARAPAAPTRGLLAGLVAFAGLATAPPVDAADDVFIYSSAGTIRGLNLTRGTDSFLTTSPIASAANALAVNSGAGYVYYGDDTSVYRWDPALGAGGGAHSLMANFATGPVTAPITELDSTAGSFLDGTYYVGSEDAQGYVTDLWALTLSLDGTQVVAADPLDLLGACGCAGEDIGGFGDVAAVLENGVATLYGSTSALGNSGGGRAGRWRFVPSTDSFAFLATAPNGQMANSLSGRLYSNVGEQVREVDRNTGATSPTTLFTTSAPIFDFTSGFSLDFGDAPDPYGGAFHRIDAAPGAPRIGALGADNDPGSLNANAGAVDGSGDDADGIDDEDAVAVAPPVSVAANAYALELECSAGTRVAGWIDLDGDRRFDARERNDNHPASCVGGRARLEWNALPGANGGDSWLRLRASSNVSSISVPVGIASDGEVEDHPVRIDGPSTTSGNCPAGSTSTVYAAADVPVAIPATSTGTVVSRITVPAGDPTASDPIVDVNVLGVVGTHTWINDLQFRLSRAGTERTLYGYSCNNENDFAFSFDDEAGTLSSACPPTSGRLHRPVQSLDAFDGAGSAGTWELRVRDRFAEDGGALRGWSLETCTAAPTVEAPALRLGKAASVNGRDVAVTLALGNVGDATLGDLELEDDLDLAFGAGAYAVSEAPALVSGPATLVPDPAYTGSGAGASLLLPGGSLEPGERATLRFAVRVGTLSVGDGGAVGDYRNSASASGTTPRGATAADTSNAGLDLSTDGDAPTPIVLDAAARLSGRVFVDVSTPTASHDGAAQPGEPGEGGRTVSITADDGTALGTALTDGEGAWRFDVPAAYADAPVTVRVADDARAAFVSEAPGFADADVADGRVVLTPGVGADVAGIDVGVAPAPRLEADRLAAAEAGARASFAHAHVARSHGSLAASLAGPDGAGGTGLDGARLLTDAACDGTGDAPFAGPVDVAPGERTCFVVEAFLPATAADGARFAVALDTVLTLSDAAGTGHGTVFRRRNVDTVTVTGSADGRLVLVKRVRNVTLGEGFGASNGGLPGHVLEYEISYRNTGTGPIEGLEIDDLVPAWTRVRPGSAACAEVPAPLTCSVVESGQSGESLGWRFGGDLPAGASGRVVYEVSID